MDYRTELKTLIDGIDSDKFIKFLHDMVIAFKEQWGY